MLRIDVRDDLATLKKLLRGVEFLKSILDKLNTFSLYFTVAVVYTYKTH